MPASPLYAQNATIGYRHRVVSEGLCVEIPDHSFTVIIGPNASGKSTLLRALARLLTPAEGQVILDGASIATYSTKEVARRVGFLPQTATAPAGITVHDLVARGRFPHQRLLSPNPQADKVAIADALDATGLSSLADRSVDELSGGQRQRVWVAMALAQQTSLLLLDEPTTFLDIVHQIDLLELFATLNRQGNTLVAILHDLNQAARYATHMIAMKDGHIVATGKPKTVITRATIKEVFDLDCLIIDDPITGTPLVIPAAN